MNWLRRKRQNNPASDTHYLDMHVSHEFCTQLVNEHSEELYRFAYRWCGKVHGAEDLVAETFFEAWKSLPKLRDRAKARAWLFQILRRRCYRQAERRDRDRPAVGIDQHELADHRDEQGRVVLQDSLQRAINGLDAKLRLPFLIVVVQGLTCREAALELEIPLGTLLTRVRRAKQQLQELLSDDLGHSDNISQFPGVAQ